MNQQQGQLLASAIVVFDIDGVVRDVGQSYRRALADTVEHFTQGAYRPTQADIDQLKSEGRWNNDWEASAELIHRSERGSRENSNPTPSFEAIVAFFQSRYRGPNPQHWTGYICNEPLLLSLSYLEHLSAVGIPWGFFSGATRASATYVLSKRLGLQSPVLIAMEDAPGKPDPTGLLATVRLLEGANQEDTKTRPANCPVIYVGDTVADMYTVQKARSLHPNRCWIGVGVLPPHVQEKSAIAHAYADTLRAAGAMEILSNVEQLSAVKIQELVQTKTII